MLLLRDALNAFRTLHAHSVWVAIIWTLPICAKNAKLLFLTASTATQLSALNASLHITWISGYVQSVQMKGVRSVSKAIQQNVLVATLVTIFQVPNACFALFRFQNVFNAITRLLVFIALQVSIWIRLTNVLYALTISLVVPFALQLDVPTACLISFWIRQIFVVIIAPITLLDVLFASAKLSA